MTNLRSQAVTGRTEIWSPFLSLQSVLNHYAISLLCTLVGIILRRAGLGFSMFLLDLYTVYYFFSCSGLEAAVSLLYILYIVLWSISNCILL